MLTIVPNGGLSSNYLIGTPNTGTVTIADDPAIITVTSTVDPFASEAGPDPGVFTFTRSGGDLATLVAHSRAALWHGYKRL